MHDLAHLTSFAVKAGWATRLERGKLHGYLRPGGVTTVKSLRKTAILLAATANAFLWAVVYAFQSNSQIRAFWQTEGEAKIDTHRETLEKERAQLTDDGRRLDELTVLSGWVREDKIEDQR